jgi:hypothetical protein
MLWTGAINGQPTRGEENEMYNKRGSNRYMSTARSASMCHTFPPKRAPLSRSSYGRASSLCYIGRFGESRRTVAVAPGASVAVFRSPRTRSSRSRPWSSLSSDGTYRRPVGSSMMPRIRPIRRTYVHARSAAAAGEGAGVTARFGAAVRGGSAVTTRATPKIASPPPMSTTPVTGSDKITAPNSTATAGLT